MLTGPAIQEARPGGGAHPPGSGDVAVQRLAGVIRALPGACAGFAQHGGCTDIPDADPAPVEARAGQGRPGQARKVGRGVSGAVSITPASDLEKVMNLRSPGVISMRRHEV